MIEFLSIRQTARKYGLSERMLRQMEREGRLPGIYTGDMHSIKRVNVQALFDQLMTESRACGKK